MKHLATVIRAVAIVTFLVLMQILGQQVQTNAERNFDFLSYAFFLPGISVLFGALLRSDVFFLRNKAFRLDWLSLAIIGLPCLLVAFSLPIIFIVLPNAPLPGFVAILYGEQIRIFAGIACGYTVINSLFAAGSRGSVAVNLADPGGPQ